MTRAPAILWEGGHIYGIGVNVRQSLSGHAMMPSCVEIRSSPDSAWTGSESWLTAVSLLLYEIKAKAKAVKPLA